MQYDPKIKNILYIILLFIIISGISLYTGYKWNQVEANYSNVEIMNDIKISTNIICNNKISYSFNENEDMKVENCYISNKPNVRFFFRFKCKNVNKDKICRLNINSINK